MEATFATPLWKFLENVCRDFHWDYAVLWKLQRDHMLLKCEEGYCHQPTLKGSMESEAFDMVFNIAGPIFSSALGSSRQSEYSHDFPVGISLDNIASAQYPLGEGVVGKVAFTGNHSWILSEDLLACDFESNMVSECPDEWLLQFAMGIKTIVLIPVAQHRVLQIGSSKKVGEDLMLVSLVRDKFSAYLNSLNVSPTQSAEFQTKTPPFRHDILSTNTIRNMCHISEENNLNNCNIMRENDISRQILGLDGISPFDHDIVSEMTNNHMIAPSILEKDMKPLSYLDYNFDICDEDIKIEAKPVEQFADEDSNNMTNISSLLSFPMNCELHKALGPTFQRASEVSQSRNLIQGNEQLIEPSKSLPNGDDREHLLEEIYATMDGFLNDDLFKELNDAMSSVESLGPLSASITECASVKVGVPRSSLAPFSTDNNLSTLIDERKLKKGDKHLKIKKGSKVCKKKGGPSESPRQRPRDRQLIQDRVKELRELVPNGSKCSIDGLLDRTIKHILFLRGISERAGKLRHWVNDEVTGQKKMRLSSPKPDKKNGTSWAFELGSDFQVCPIVVKDLERPGHMLIEMLCNDNALFLEIAEVIRRLDLTLLKGVMESRANNTWAHFIIEVSEGFQRLDIFWPLMQLLQKDGTPILDRI